MYKYKLPVVLIVHFGIEQWSSLLLQVILDFSECFLVSVFVSIIMYTSEHTHSVPLESDQTHQQIQLEYVFLQFMVYMILFPLF